MGRIGGIVVGKKTEGDGAMVATTLGVIDGAGIEI